MLTSQILKRYLYVLLVENRMLCNRYRYMDRINFNIFCFINKLSIDKNRTAASKFLLQVRKINDTIDSYLLLNDVFISLNKRDVPCYLFQRPGTIDKSYYSLVARRRMDQKLDFPTIYANQEKYAEVFKELLGDLYSSEYVNELGKIPQVIKRGAVYGHEDYQSKLINVINGKRVVTNSTPNNEKTIHIFGRCGVFGYAVEDKDTLPSLLQKKLIEKGINNISIVNYGLWGGDDKCIINNIIVESQKFKKGDIVVLYMRKFDDLYLHKYCKNGLYYFDCTIPFHQNNISKWCFYERAGHLTKEGYNLTANIIIEKLLKTNFQSKINKLSNCLLGKSNQNISNYITRISNKEFHENLSNYLHDIGEKYPTLTSPNICGAIVMNCNPFTLGHRYLVEYASKKVDRLFIFVLEEDKSYFKFKDRYELVQVGTSDLKNVIVIPSKEFMISAITFPEYFMKDYINNIEIDATNDLQIFGKYIAPALNITVRFAGEEPFDMITKQYNENMQAILPQYGIKFIEIPRYSIDEGKVVSASTVRRLLKDKNFDELKRYVPETTYNYLITKYS